MLITGEITMRKREKKEKEKPCVGNLDSSKKQRKILGYINVSQHLLKAENWEACMNTNVWLPAPEILNYFVWEDPRHLSFKSPSDDCNVQPELRTIGLNDMRLQISFRKKILTFSLCLFPVPTWVKFKLPFKSNLLYLDSNKKNTNKP